MILNVARPFSLEWDGMVSLWSNYDLDDRYSTLVRSRERFLDIVAKLKEAMYEGGQENEIEWWYEWSNDVVGVLHFWRDSWHGANGSFQGIFTHLQ